MKPNSITRMVIFYVIAITLSNIFRFHLFGLKELEDNLPQWIQILSGPFQAFGILLGSVISLQLLKKQKLTKYSLFGTSVKWSLTMIVIPIILLTILGVSNAEHANAHSFGLISGIGTLIYCYFEEIGWRGYLHDELGDIKEWKRVLVIGFLWYLWHLSFIDNHNLLSNLVFFAILTIGSWGLGKVIETTKSIFSVTAFT